MFSPDFHLLWSTQNHWPARQRLTYSPVNAAVLWLVVEGKMRVSLDRTTFEIGVGQAFLQFPGVQREILAQENSRWFSVALQTRVSWPKHPPGLVWTSDDSEFTLLYANFEQILTFHDSPELAAQWKTEGAARLLLGICFDHAPPQSSSPDWLQRALEIMERQPQIDLGKLAAEVGYSPTQFRTQFRLKTGLAPRDFAAQCLAARSRQLLSGTDWPIERVAHELEFAAATHFCRFFKRRFGMSPTQFRRLLS